MKGVGGFVLGQTIVLQFDPQINLNVTNNRFAANNNIALYASLDFYVKFIFLMFVKNVYFTAF